VKWPVKKVVIVGDIYLEVALSNIYALQMQGAEVKVWTKTLIPKYIGVPQVTVRPNLKKALEWCDVANILEFK
jgi:aspartate carbamoyltransferase catalytic subunit